MSALIPALIELLLRGRGGGGGGGGGKPPASPKPPADPNAAWEKAAERSFQSEFDNRARVGDTGIGDALVAARNRNAALRAQLEQLDNPAE